MHGVNLIQAIIFEDREIPALRFKICNCRWTRGDDSGIFLTYAIQVLERHKKRIDELEKEESTISK